MKPILREFCELAAHEFGYNLEWSGSGLDEVGIDAKTKQTIIKINPKFYRPAEVDLLIGDYTKINKLCGWKPRTSFHDLIKLMCKEEPIIQSIMG
jgi:GDPmannose 4,6-dehydratase